MITHLRIENYQSHALTEIDISPTVTVFTGESDQGKTAVLRAVRKVLRNTPTGDFFVRWGQKVCKVALTVDGIVVERTVGVKKSGVNTYTVGEDSYNNFGTTVPEDVRVALQVADIQTFDKDKIDFNIHTQHEGEFLVGKSGVEALRGRIFARATGSDVVNRAIVQKNADIRANKQELDRLVLRQKELQAKLDVLLPARDAGVMLVEVEDTYGTVLHLSSKIDTLRVLGTELQTLSDAIRQTKVIEQVPPLATHAAETSLSSVTAARVLYNELQTTYAQIKRLKPVSLLPALSVEGIETQVGTVSGLRGLLQELKTAWAIIKPLKVLKSDTMVFDVSPATVSVEAHTRLTALQRDLLTTTKQMEDSTAQVEAGGQELDAAQIELEGVKVELGVCPICERPFNDYTGQEHA
jgi:DNA repair ATPase RecN